MASPTTTVVCLVAPSTSSGVATLFGIWPAQLRLPRVTTRKKDATPPRLTTALYMVLTASPLLGSSTAFWLAAL